MHSRCERSGVPAKWDRFKVKIHSSSGHWRAYRLRFHSDGQRYIDLRFAAEGPVKAWIDDVAVCKLLGARS